LIWYLLADPRLSERARNAFVQSAQQGNPIGVSAISLVEIIYLTEKGRIPAVALETLERELGTSGTTLTVIALDQSIAMGARKINRASVPELPDRVIAATAHYFGIPLITRDHEIRTANIETLW
jgi:PIN domain nuclease of toxin-antitoxin system